MPILLIETIREADRMVFYRSQWCADLAASVIEVTTAMTELTESSKNQNKPHRSVSAYDAITETETADDDTLQAKLRRRLIAYVESSLELPSSAKL